MESGHIGIYIGIGKEHGKQVLYNDAFMYAMECVTTDEEYMEAFCEAFGPFPMFLKPDDLTRFRKRVVEWFYRENWL